MEEGQQRDDGQRGNQLSCAPAAPLADGDPQVTPLLPGRFRPYPNLHILAQRVPTSKFGCITKTHLAGGLHKRVNSVGAKVA